MCVLSAPLPKCLALRLSTANFKENLSGIPVKMIVGILSRCLKILYGKGPERISGEIPGIVSKHKYWNEFLGESLPRTMLEDV